MKRLLFSLMIITAIFSIAGFGGSLAYFSDEDVSTDDTFEVGVWDLEDDSETYAIENVDANDTGSHTFTATNTGTVDAYLDLTIGVMPVGDLIDHMTGHLYVVGGGDVYPPGPMNGIAGVYDLNFVLGPSVSVLFNLDWAVDGTYVPVAGDKVTITLNYDLQAQP